jgi:TonB family protein
MGKIVKYCSSCDEGFSEKFGFCPNCATPLQAYEMNPVTGQAAAPDVTASAADDTVLEIPEETPVYEAANEEIVEVPAYETSPAETTPIEIANADVIEEETEVAEPETVRDTVPSWSNASAESYDGTGFHNYEAGAYTREDDGGFYVTVIQEKNSKQRNLLLLGSLILMLSLSVGATIASLFQKDLGVGAIGDERSLAYLLEDVPMPVEDKPEPEKNDDDDGGGGGGGKEDPKPVNQGDLPDQTPDPIRPPDPKVHRMDDPALVIPPPSTQGNVKNEKKYGQWGDPNSKFGDLSSGPGSGGGMGTGIGTGAGSGRGTGQGSGTGSGSGSGFGDGNGDGDGIGGNRVGAPPPRPVGVTSPFKILSKPQARYNDAARTNGVQGSVRLKVTLLASGQVGSITPVTRLPHGLTEQAIAAARLIRFEPAKVNGVPVSKIVTLEYSFSIY